MSKYMVLWVKNCAPRVAVNEATSVWQLVTSTVPLSSNLVSVLFDMLINYLDAAECTISKFDANTELGSTADSLEGPDALQRDLEKLEHWAMINGMKFNRLKHQIE
ncbi:hypothetical protein WISP_78574 [Willisornis vidua]|uniref:Rna-directed dna polymerase from mobile element jockey-like n=1 Tax=Willisornis vidua TaxID=1566151 RepID=A0ABQ9D5C0_9PASS|nr:hypothetical protein WISP_78574 [Willisornis vidua]